MERGKNWILFKWNYCIVEINFLNIVCVCSNIMMFYKFIYINCVIVCLMILYLMVFFLKVGRWVFVEFEIKNKVKMMVEMFGIIWLGNFILFLLGKLEKCFFRIVILKE